ncbi:hypothetical protein LR48_Vigan09g084100 [Vigna angularis]|uniref:Uncharacterized protein n=1 Tax=Phaseolus angularis TaxID=3914 RepID=A0A0L9VB87_PHAAN|nr:hypothetical protein LR48_Vigan09g084100 [Vigna angularis]
MQIFDIIKKWSSRFLEDTTRMQQLQISEHIQSRDPAVERSLQSCKLWKLKVQLQHPASFEESSPTQQRREHSMSRGAHGPPRCSSGRSRGEIPVSSKCEGCTIQQEVKQAYEWKVGGRNSRLFQQQAGCVTVGSSWSHLSNKEKGRNRGWNQGRVYRGMSEVLEIKRKNAAVEDTAHDWLAQKDKSIGIEGGDHIL